MIKKILKLRMFCTSRVPKDSERITDLSSMEGLMIFRLKKGLLNMCSKLYIDWKYEEL